MRPLGRRPGNRDTRADILDAARAEFARAGYASTSLRAIARRAGVDPALVHHYFDDKVTLFLEATQLPEDPARVPEEAASADGPPGEHIVRGFLAMWDRPSSEAGAAPPGRRAPVAARPSTATSGPTRREVEPADGAVAAAWNSPFVRVAQAMCASPEAADAMREFIAERVWSRVQGPPGDSAARRQRRHALVASQLIGLAWARYVLRVEPLASASGEEVAQWVGPTIDRYMGGEVNPH
jgi:AcrR family transcriptional regulator